ncbi:Ig-like domain-containing protein, partial [Geobacter sp. SVR]
VAINGTTTGAENGRTVTVHLNGRDYTATVNNNTWTLNAPAIDVAALVNGQGYTVTADVSDAAGNAAPQAGRTITVDTTAPTITI